MMRLRRSYRGADPVEHGLDNRCLSSPRGSVVATLVMLDHGHDSILRIASA